MSTVSHETEDDTFSPVTRKERGVRDRQSYVRRLDKSDRRSLDLSPRVDVSTLIILLHLYSPSVVTSTPVTGQSSVGPKSQDQD